MKSSSDLYSCNLVNPPYILSKPLTFLNNNNLQLYRLFTGVNHLNLLDRNVSRYYLLSSWQHSWFHHLHCKCFNVACQPTSSVQIEGIWVRICWRLSFKSICCFWHWKFVGFHWPCSRIRELHWHNRTSIATWNICPESMYSSESWWFHFFCVDWMLIWFGHLHQVRLSRYWND